MSRIRQITEKPLLLIAMHFTPELFEIFPDEGINIADCNGNCVISARPLLIRISGQKSFMPKEKVPKAFNEAGLKLIFYFLLDDENINKPYRRISEETGLSLGTIKNVIEDLNTNYIIHSDKGRFIRNKKDLLEKWQIHYNSTLKPKLLLREMEFTDNDISRDWESIVLPEGMCWGGEGAAYLLDHFLVPELFDIYTDVPIVQLLRTRKVRFSEGGPIKLYRKFWKGNENSKVAPKILVYADLMGSGNSRCIEAAQRLIEN